VVRTCRVTARRCRLSSADSWPLKRSEIAYSPAADSRMRASWSPVAGIDVPFTGLGVANMSMLSLPFGRFKRHGGLESPQSVGSDSMSM